MILMLAWVLAASRDLVLAPHDSDEFQKALERWAGRIQDACPTLRSRTRMVNKLRFYALMIQATIDPDEKLDNLSSAIVAFGVLEQDDDMRRKIMNNEFQLEDLKAGKSEVEEDSLVGDCVAMNQWLERKREVFQWLTAWENPKK